jgi:hypothetical protein
MNITVNDDAPAYASLQALIQRHGVLAVGAAYLRAALARRKHPPDRGAWVLNDRLRRDIGLPPSGDGRWR